MRATQGQSIAEFLITIAVLAPLLLMLASFANLLDLSTTGVEASRFAAWQRTVYQERPDYSATDIEAKVQQNIKELFLESSKFSDFGPAQKAVAGKFPSLVDRTAEVGLKMPDTPSALGQIASSNTRIARKLGFSESDTALYSPEVSLPLNKESSLFRLIDLVSYTETEYDVPNSTPYDEVAGTNRFHIANHSALLASGFQHAGHEDMKKKVEDAAFGGSTLRAFQPVALGVLNFLGFDEVRPPTRGDGRDVVPDEQADILPDDRLN